MGDPRWQSPLEASAVIERRALLRRAGLTVAGVTCSGGLASLLTACSDGGSSERPASTVGPSTAPATASLATTVDPGFEPDTPYWLQQGFAPVQDEVEHTDLPVRGSLPPELDGLYVRNGSNPRSGTSGHWFLGDGMVHGVRVRAGKAEWYRNRYVQTPLVAAGADLLSSGAIPGQANNQSNVSVFLHGGKLLSSGEIGWPYELSATDLTTVGAYDYGGALTTAMTAHPKIDPATGQLHFFGYGFFPPYLTYHVADAEGRLVTSEEVTVAGPTMIHDFAITDRDAIFWELPVLFDLDIALEGGMPYSWDPSYGARLGIMPLGGPAAAIQWIEIDPCYVFHGVNAFRDGDVVVLDVCRMASAFGDGGGQLGLDEGSRLHRWTVDLGGATPVWRSEQVSDLDMDLPSIDRRRTGTAQRFAWFADVTRGARYLDFAGVTQWDFETGTTARWDPGPGRHANEAFFVAGDDGEGEGWLFTYVYDQSTETSNLAVLDATDIEAGPVAEVELPVRVPYGFHGVWVPAAPS